MNTLPILYALLGGLAAWGVAALGAATVVFFKTINQKVLAVMLGFASGVMLAAAFWSLLLPAIEMGGTFPTVAGFMLGGGFLYLADRVLPHIHNYSGAAPEGIPSGLRRSVLLMLAITLHNIPEGLALGVAFGSIGADPGALSSALALTIGISIHDIPEGAAVSIPLRREGFSRGKSFKYGQASALVQPIAAVAGAALTSAIGAILPYALAFAAGAMVFVVAEEMIPEARASAGEAHFATFGVMGGFLVMIMLETML